MPDDTMDRPNRQTDWLTDLIRQTLSVPISNADRVLTGRSQCLRPTFYVRTFVQAHNEREQRTTKCSGAWNNNLLHKNRRQLNIRKIFSVCATATGFFYIQDTRDYVAASVCGTGWAKTPFVGIKVAFATAAAFALSRNRSIGICDFPIAVVSLSQYYFHGIFSFFFFLPLSIENIKTTDNVTTSGQETLLPHNYIKRQQKRRCWLQYPVMKRMYCIMNSQFHLELKLG